MTIATWAASILAVIFATLFADAYWSLREREKRDEEQERRMKWREGRIKLLEEQVGYWSDEATFWREQALQLSRITWPVDVKNAWAKMNPN